MPPRPGRPPLGLFDNPAGAFSLEELAETVRRLNASGPGRTVDELSRAVFTELAMKRTPACSRARRRGIRMARARPPHAEITGSQ